MNIVILCVEVVFSAVLLLSMKSKPPKEVARVISYYDCCDPGLNQTAKENCGFAGKRSDHILTEINGDRKVFVWSSCEVGKEPWRKYE